MSQAGYMH